LAFPFPFPFPLSLLPALPLPFAPAWLVSLLPWLGVVDTVAAGVDFAPELGEVGELEPEPP
jgi:hypothetical protein